MAASLKLETQTGVEWFYGIGFDLPIASMGKDSTSGSYTPRVRKGWGEGADPLNKMERSINTFLGIPR